MSRRTTISMTNEEIQAFLQEERTVQVATIDHDGYPHQIAMWYALFDHQIAFWTYACKFWNEAGRICLIILVKRGVSFLKDKKLSLAFHAP